MLTFPPLAIILIMIDNYLEQEYQSYNLIYTHPQTQHGLYIGDFQSATDRHFHANCNIRTVITAAAHLEHLQYNPTLKHIVYPLMDSKAENIAGLFQNFYEVVESGIKEGGILVHCSAGISRSSTLVISYLMRKEKLDFKETITFVRKARPKVLPNLGFERQLKKYEETLRKQLRSERVPRRSQVRTSQSGKSERSIRLDVFPFAEAFPSLAMQKSKTSEKPRHYTNHLSDKGLQLLRVDNSNRREISRNRIFLADRIKRVNPSHHVLRTELYDKQNQSLLHLLRVQNQRLKSKTIVSDPPSGECLKPQQTVKKHFSAYRKSTLHKYRDRLT